MKKAKKILSIVCAAILVAAILVAAAGCGNSSSVPELDPEKLLENPVNENTAYVVGQPPYTDKWVFDTPMGLNDYWIGNHTGGNGMEIVLQQTRDGELIMLSEALPALSNSEILFGKDAAVHDLTLEEMRMINLAYNFVNTNGEKPYADLTDEQLADYSVVSLDELLTYFGAPNKITAKLYLRFFDESQITDMDDALQTIFDGVTANDLKENVIFCPQSDESAAAADSVCPELIRAATAAEAKALYSDCQKNKEQDALPYSVIYEKADGQFGKERFIHYARNLGLAVVLSDVSADDAVQYCNYGVSAIATSDAKSVIQILKDADLADLG